MGKALTLLQRLNTALGQTNSETQEKRVYGLLFKAAMGVNTYEFEDFYTKYLNPEMLTPKESTDDLADEEINYGRDLAKVLEETIMLPDMTKRHAGPKILRARLKEYHLLESFIKKRGYDGTHIQV